MALLTDLYGEKRRYASALSKRGYFALFPECQRNRNEEHMNKINSNY